MAFSKYLDKSCIEFLPAPSHGVWMNDHFALLGVARQPWLDPVLLKERYHALTTEQHPDVAAKGGENAFADVNVAFQTLNEPRGALKHFLDLENEGSPAPARHQAAPTAIGALFLEMGARKGKLDAFLKKRTAASSALAKALLLSEQLELQEGLEGWLADLESEQAREWERLRGLNERWLSAATPDERRDLLPMLAEIAQALGYLDKWIAQIREGVLRLYLD